MDLTKPIKTLAQVEQLVKELALLGNPQAKTPAELKELKARIQAIK